METQIIDGRECYRGFRPINGARCTPEFKLGIDEFIQRCKSCGTGRRALDAAPKPKAAAPKPSREGRRLHRALDNFIESAFETPQEEQMLRNYDRGESALLSDGPDYAALQRHADQQRLHGGVAERTPEQKTTPGYGEVTYQSGIAPREMETAREREFEIDRGESFSSAQDYSALQRHADAMRTHWGLPARPRGSDSSTAHPDNNRADYLKIVAEVQASELRNGGLKQ